MACPLFVPGSPLTGFLRETMPLGDLYDGRCAAAPNEAIPVEILRSCCNLGYARGCCGRAAEASADAVRFLIKSENGGVVQVAWAIERNHHPVAVGTANATNPGTGNEALDAQIRAYALITRPRP